MTDPTSTFATVPVPDGPGRDPSATDRLITLATGNANLVQQPQLLQALVNGNATKAQTDAINMYTGGLEAEKQVRLAAASGVKIDLSSEQQNALTQMGVDFSGVLKTQSDYEAQEDQQLAAQGEQLARDSSGKVIYDSSGNAQIEKIPSGGKSQQGWSWGRIWHDVTNNPVTSALGKAWNFVDTNVAQSAQNVGENQFDRQIQSAQTLQTVMQNLKGNLNALPNQSVNIFTTTAQQQQYAQDMRNAGYDPLNPFSVAAFDASGKAYVDTSGLSTQWDQSHAADSGLSGDDAVQLAKTYLDSPGSYVRNVENDSTLTAAQKAAKLQQLATPGFNELVQRVSASKASIGNVVMSNAGVDPVEHPAEFGYGSAGVDFAASLIGDPLLALGAVGKAAKISQVGIRDMGDANRISDILLTKANPVTGVYRANVQRGFQTFLDNLHPIRDLANAGEDATDEQRVAAAAAYAKIRATTPGLEPLVGDFVGNHQVLGFNPDAAASEDRFVMGQGKPIMTLADAADYLGSKMALTRLASGRAAVESTLMPGALSAFGFRRFRGAVAGANVARQAGKNLDRYDVAERLLPTATDAIASDGTILAAKNADLVSPAGSSFKKSSK